MIVVSHAEAPHKRAFCGTVTLSRGNIGESWTNCNAHMAYEREAHHES